MWKYITMRLLGGVVTLFAASFVVFGALYLVPGDPVANLLGGMQVTPEMVEAVRQQYHLDDPFLMRYVSWITSFVQGDLGQSLQFRQDVGPLLASRVPVTIMLVVMSGLWIVIGGLGMGVLAALFPGRVDRAVVNLTALASAVPVFITALILIFIFSTELRWFPAYGSGGGFWDSVYHLILPSLAMGLFYTGLVARVSRASIRRELDSEHVWVARARGIEGSPLFTKHVLHNALPPILTQSGIVVAGLLVSSQIVERAFSLNGLGSLLISSVQSIDFAVVQAVMMIVILAFVLTNLVIDLLLIVIDPRIAIGGKK